jgi:hypothetical protein
LTEIPTLSARNHPNPDTQKIEANHATADAVATGDRRSPEHQSLLRVYSGDFAPEYSGAGINAADQAGGGSRPATEPPAAQPPLTACYARLYAASERIEQTIRARERATIAELRARPWSAGRYLADTVAAARRQHSASIARSRAERDQLVAETNKGKQK